MSDKRAYMFQIGTCALWQATQTKKKESNSPMALYHFSAKVLSRSTRSTVRAVAYRAGCELTDVQTGETFNYTNKGVQHVELVLPKDAPAWAMEIQSLIKENRQAGVQAFSNIVEKAEKRVDAQVWREVEFALHQELTHEQNIALAREFVEDQIASRGMAALLNFHCDKDEETEKLKPHCHVLLTTRRLEETELSTSFNTKKEIAWNAKALILDLREQWAAYSNFHLKLHGHDAQIDHRSYKERGIDIEAQPKRGKGILEIEKKAHAKVLQDQIEEIKSFSVTDKAKVFQDVQLRNLYRIMQRPEVVFDIVTKHHTTFTWADVQKVLHQHIDDASLFQRMEARLQKSNELLLLRPEEGPLNEESLNESCFRQGPLTEDCLRQGKGAQSSAIYTTRSLLKAERDLIERAEELDKAKTHSVKESHVETAIAKGHQELKEKRIKEGSLNESAFHDGSLSEGLSQDQEKAIRHLVDPGQLKCVVGIAGAGKTTALGVCQDIWKTEGYAVYGLAPTGKAAQNLQQNGIESATLHKFLKSFEEGKCQYNPDTILILDEAGMVDVERFSKLLSAVKQLGVKLVIVGDGAQLQPVEAGPAFRLVTERIGRSELNTVLRQRENWQKEATLLFGKQQTQEAIQQYMDKGYVHIIEEKIPSFTEALRTEDKEKLTTLYEISTRVSTRMYREMAKDVAKASERRASLRQTSSRHPSESNPSLREETPENASFYIKQHQDYTRYLKWKTIEKATAAYVLKKGEPYSRQGVDVWKDTKEALLKAWHSALHSILKREGAPLEGPLSEETSVMMAFSNKDVNDLNTSARHLLKQSGHISKEEFIYTTKREIEDDFGRTTILSEEKAFSKGDRIVFTRNQYGLGVQNGSMGTITELNKNTIHVKLDEGVFLEENGSSERDISFAPKLNPFFDHGWAITIHKSQGTTVDQAYVLASYEMSQNLAYVAMTRHRHGVHVFGSSLDFWRPEKLPEILSKSGEKLAAADYLDASSLMRLMKQDDLLLAKIFTRISDELEAMGAVSKRAFWQAADHFLGINREKDIRENPESLYPSIREEARAENLFQQNQKTNLSWKPQLQDVPTAQTLFSYQTSRPFREGKASRTKSEIGMNPRVVEAALVQNMSSFADDVFSSLGEPYHQSSSSSTERRYGKKGHIAVNLKTGAWIDYKDNDKCGGPLHMLTKLKGLVYEEAVHQGATWAGLFPTNLKPFSIKEDQLTSFPVHRPQEREDLTLMQKEKVQRAQALWGKGRPLEETIAERYLKVHRKIRGNLPQDLRYLPEFRDRDSGREYPCLMGGARSPEGNVTAIQLTFLNPKTAQKADVAVQKKSFGVIKGSSVILQEDKSSKVLFIAEGIETALSIKEAGFKGTIKASLGLSNILRLLPKDQDTSVTSHIIICADHDSPNSPAAKNLERSVQILRKKTLDVTVVKPDKLHEDFNDVLKTKGTQGVRNVIEKNLSPTLLKDVQNHTTTPSQKDLFHKEILRKEAEQAHEDRHTKQAFEATTKQIEKEKVLLKQKDHSM